VSGKCGEAVAIRTREVNQKLRSLANGGEGKESRDSEEGYSSHGRQKSGFQFQESQSGRHGEMLGEELNQTQGEGSEKQRELKKRITVKIIRLGQMKNPMEEKLED